MVVLVVVVVDDDDGGVRAGGEVRAGFGGVDVRRAASPSPCTTDEIG